MVEKISLRKGNNGKKAQKYQNKTAFKHNKNSKKTKTILALPIGGVCERCREIIQWRKTFRKYKPLTVPKKCVKCDSKSVKEAYHVICINCSRTKKQCAKCLETYEVQEDTVEEEPIEESEKAQECNEGDFSDENSSDQTDNEIEREDNDTFTDADETDHSDSLSDVDDPDSLSDVDMFQKSQNLSPNKDASLNSITSGSGKEKVQVEIIDELEAATKLADLMEEAHSSRNTTSAVEMLAELAETASKEFESGQYKRNKAFDNLRRLAEATYHKEPKADGGDVSIKLSFDMVVDSNKNKRFVCRHEGCNKGFPSRGHLIRHQRIHTGEKPFKCLFDECTKSFSRYDNMLQHFKTHSKQSSRSVTPQSIRSSPYDIKKEKEADFAFISQHYESYSPPKSSIVNNTQLKTLLPSKVIQNSKPEDWNLNRN